MASDQLMVRFFPFAHVMTACAHDLRLVDPPSLTGGVKKEQMHVRGSLDVGDCRDA
jgi:hypothetical protein